ncbi:hypothetical protein OHB12_13945 [Nocardia sp. NBC_01730]|uniref:hypothetical protein n=1 Tax=Nocardia sp. NBC_01730 TaxID=2975998 RepID=UPI002E12E06A|nr:hypothetical protein OHB12_13945 [Nocardia sp. NBC_01730]
MLDEVPRRSYQPVASHPRRQPSLPVTIAPSARSTRQQQDEFAATADDAVRDNDVRGEDTAGPVPYDSARREAAIHTAWLGCR